MVGGYRDGDFVVARYNPDLTFETDFGTEGWSQVDFGGGADQAYGLALAPDGEIVLTGTVFVNDRTYFGVARFSADGQLDSEFGGDGLVRTNFPDFGANSAEAVAVQSDGKVLVAGQVTIPNTSNTAFALARYHADGSIDLDFGDAGMVVTDFSGGVDEACSVVVQSDGRIVVGGHTTAGNENFALARYNSDGTLDSSFGSGGRVTTDFLGSNDRIYGLALQSDGKIVAVGCGTNSSGNQDFALARYNSDGTLDSSFGSGGRVLTPFVAGQSEDAYGVVIQPNGKIVVAGCATSVYGHSNFALARYNVNGTLDSTFGVGGKRVVDFASGEDKAYGLVLQSDGKIVVSGYVYSDSSYNFALTRFLTSGAQDVSFGDNGWAVTDFSGSQDYVYSTGILDDDSIVVAGTSSVETSDFAVAIYTPDGTLDGATTTDFGTGLSGSQDYAAGIAVQADGGIVVVGYTNVTGTNDFALARYLKGNEPPVADAGGPYSVAEGGSLTLDATASTDPEQDGSSLIYTWDLDGDGVYGESGAAALRGNETGAQPSFSAAGLDGQTITVSLRVTDEGELASDDTATITVTNVAPTVDAGPNGSINEGGTFSGTGSFTDPAPTAGPPPSTTATAAACSP